jgi:hypothetical protein
MSEREDPTARILQRWTEVLTEEMQQWVQDLLADAFNPADLLRFIRSMGIDVSRLTATIEHQSGFDPYRILGLERSASDEEVKHRYRDLLHKLHPDTAGMQGTDFLLRLVLAAYEMIAKERGWH